VARGGEGRGEVTLELSSQVDSGALYRLSTVSARAVGVSFRFFCFEAVMKA
jgi:hypothetical protein